MRHRYNPPGLTAAQQFAVLRARSPVGGDGTLAQGALTWLYCARPSAIGRLYTMLLRFRQGGVPTVVVRNPNLRELAQGKPLPHVYAQQPPRLCLFLPRLREWNDRCPLVDTMLPWSVIWLYYFEAWLRTGEWTGGGEHPHGEAK